MELKNLKEFNNQFVLFQHLIQEDCAWEVVKNLRCMLGIYDTWEEFEKEPFSKEKMEKMTDLCCAIWSKSDSEDIYNIGAWCTKQILSGEKTFEELETMNVATILDAVYDEYHWV